MKKIIALIFVVVLGFTIEMASADFIFGEPTKVPNVNSTSYEGRAQISRDGLELYFTSAREHIAGECYYNLWMSRRDTISDPWSVPIKLDAPINSAWSECSPSISSDGLELYFADGYPNLISSSRCTVNPNGYGHSDLWVSKRASKNDPWGIPENLGPTINTEYGEDTPCISANGLELYFMSGRPEASNSDIFVAVRPTQHDPWGEPVKLGPNVNSDQFEYTPFISSDGLLLCFARGFSVTEIYLCRRTKTTDPWGPAELFSPVNSGVAEFFLFFSEEESTLYFTRGTDVFAQDYNIWQVEVTPIVDLNSDGYVDSEDMCIIVDNWHTENTLCDIAPAPLGDGFVDIQDLIVLAEHLFEEFPVAQ